MYDAKVSIIIPTYGKNSNPLKSIESVFNQDYKNLEIIVVDDNGKGTKQQKVNEQLFAIYKDNDKFKYLIHKKNMGGSVARNTGVKNSSGQYLCFLDDDDEFVQKSKITLQMKEAIKLDETWAGTYSSLHIYNGKNKEILMAKKSGHLLKEFIRGKMSIGTASPIIRKDAYYDINGFDESFIRHQDWEFFARLLDKYKIKSVKEAYYNRYYKVGVKEYSIEERIQFMDKYVNKMKSSLTSLTSNELNTLMKHKYIQIIFKLLKKQRYIEAAKICKDQKFNVCDYVIIIKEAVEYAYRKFILKY